MRLDRAEQHEGAAGKNEKHEHLRQSGKRELPERVANKEQSHSEQREAAVEEPLGDEIIDQDREQEKRHRYAGDDAVTCINNVFRSHRPGVLRETKKERIDERVERRVIRVRQIALR